jgi:hypothetical protein
MSPSKTEFYRRQAESCCLKAIVAEDIEKRMLHWIEAAARWISFGREEGALPQTQTSLPRRTRCPKVETTATPGECKNAVTHEEDRMCDYCHDLAAEDLVATLPPENELPLGRGALSLLVTPATWASVSLGAPDE